MINRVTFLLCAVLLIIIFFVLIIRSENRRFRITEYTIHSPKIKKQTQIAVISDLHNYEYGENNQLLLDAIRKIAPDFVLSCGDMVEAGENVKITKRTLAFLQQLSGEFDFIYGYGNHECKICSYQERYPLQAREFYDGLKKLKEIESCRVLDNDNTDLDQFGIRIFGLNLEYDYFRKFRVNKTTTEHMEELVGKPSSEFFNLLIGHNPDQFDTYARWGADLVLSGHIHGGMIALPGGRGLISPKFTLFPRYYAGVYHMDNTDMIVSRGLGNHSIHIRIFNRAEIVVVNLCPSE